MPPSRANFPALRLPVSVPGGGCAGSGEEDLLRAIRSGGDGAALEALLSRYERPLIAFLSSYAGDPELARDLCQETFLRLIRRPPSRLFHGSLKPWLFRVARNLANDHLRRRREEVPLEAVPEPTAPRPPGLSPADVHRLLAGLPRRTREMITLRVYGGLTYKEIARQTKLPLGTVLARVHRGFRRLRETLEDTSDGPI